MGGSSGAASVPVGGSSGAVNASAGAGAAGAGMGGAGADGVGTGGVSLGGALGGGAGAAGASAAGGASGASGATSAAGSSACPGLFCEDFEEGQLDTTKWDLQKGGGGMAMVQTQTVAHGKYALQVHSTGAKGDFAMMLNEERPRSFAGRWPRLWSRVLLYDREQ